jgi:hypothetical protein
MADRFTVRVPFNSLENAQEHGDDATVALAAELDGATVTRPDENGVFMVTLEADSLDQARERVWESAGAARITDWIEQVA